MEEDFWADTLVAGVKAEMVGKKRAARMSFMVVKSNSNKDSGVV